MYQMTHITVLMSFAARPVRAVAARFGARVSYLDVSVVACARLA